MASIPPSLSGLLGPLVDLLESPAVRRIVVDRPGVATVISATGRATVPIDLDAGMLARMVKGLAQRASRAPGEGQPVVEAMLRDGTRFLVTGPPTVPGPMVSISRPVVVATTAWGPWGPALGDAMRGGLNLLVVSPGDVETFVALGDLIGPERRYALGDGGAAFPGDAVRIQADTAEAAWRLLGGIAPDRVFVDEPTPAGAWAAVAALSGRVAPAAVRIAGRSADDGLARLEALARAGAPPAAGAAVDGFIASGIDLVAVSMAGHLALAGVRAERGLPVTVPLADEAALCAYLRTLGLARRPPADGDPPAVPEPSAPPGRPASNPPDEGPRAGIVVAPDAAGVEPLSGTPLALVRDDEASVPPSEPPAEVAPAGDDVSDDRPAVASAGPGSVAESGAGAAQPAESSPSNSDAPVLAPPPSIGPAAASVEAPGPDPEGILVPASKPLSAAPAPSDSIDIEIDLSMVTRSHSVPPHESVESAPARSDPPPGAVRGATPSTRPTEDPLRALLASLGAEDEEEDEDESVNTMVSQLEDALGADAAEAVAGRSFSEILRSISGVLDDDDSVDRAAATEHPRGRRGSTRIHADDE
ncbi:MAG: hypothetical protein H6702_01380 [Myxococcales bacterium]|nr:hypothetical protein [Myxococcales bacterium]